MNKRQRKKNRKNWLRAVGVTVAEFKSEPPRLPPLKIEAEMLFLKGQVGEFR